MLKTTAAALVAAALALTISVSASAGDRDTLADGQGWDLSLYGAGDAGKPRALAGGGLALSMRPDRSGPAAALSIDYAGGGSPITVGSGLGLVASVDLVGPGKALLGGEPFLRLSYRAGAPMGPFGGSADQLVTVRAGLRW